jgi:ring-1,2-phenylacetyl-CoA epoxidase subunit PaaE
MTTPVLTRSRPRFHRLTVSTVEPLTDDSVVVTFAVPPPLRATYAFSPGQHLTVRTRAFGDEVRRSYSICSTPGLLGGSGLVRIGVRAIADGVFSGYATTALRPGDEVDVAPPLGRFTTALAPDRTRHYAAIVAGSGITPVLSLIATALETEPASRCTLVYGNRRASTVMFAEELGDLKDRYRHRLHVVHVLSREPQLSPLLSGRLDPSRLETLFGTGLVDVSSVDEWFLCGPYELVLGAQQVLTGLGVPAATVHTELFHVESAPPPPRPARDEALAGTTVTIVLDGRESTFTMGGDERVLDAALRMRSELPYACKGGVCSTCRARVVEGEVVMAPNYALEPDELAAGYVLTCQASPVSERLVVDYDA